MDAEFVMLIDRPRTSHNRVIVANYWNGLVICATRADARFYNLRNYRAAADRSSLHLDRRYLGVVILNDVKDPLLK